NYSPTGPPSCQHPLGLGRSGSIRLFSASSRWYSLPIRLMVAGEARGRGKQGGRFEMLVLTRKLGENIRIGDSVKITVLEVRSGQVKLGIEAPPEIKVHREEIYARIQEENRRAQRQAENREGTSEEKGNPGS